MSIRSNTLPTRADLSPELQDILRRNGMQAHIIRQGDSFRLAVQGHDSPLLTYPVSTQQLKALTDWGTNYANKEAYTTFTALVGNDFYVPKNLVHARNANGRVAMGLHGYRIGVGEYDRQPWDRRGSLWARHDRTFLGWTPRQQEGWHMRRVGGALFMQGAPMVHDRPDGRMKPGELQNGSYGFYYKGQGNAEQRQQTQQPLDVLSELKTVITPIEPRPRTTEPAKPYNELVNSEVYFSDERFRECLDSHGIIFDQEKKQLTIQSSSAKQDFVYDLREDETARLSSNSIKDVNLQQRLDIINGVISKDFDDKITMDTLNSKEQIAIRLNPDVEAELNNRESVLIEHVQTVRKDSEKEAEERSVAHVDGNRLYEMNGGKGWYREERHGREVNVGDIKVEPVRDSRGEPERSEKGEIKYRMTAVINGQSISHEITQKQYDKFLAVDDYHRMKLFSKIFDEVDMKNVPGMHSSLGARIGGALLAGLSVMGELAQGHHSGPSVFMEHHHDHGPHVYFKPGVDSPQELASRAFEAGLHAGETGIGLGHQR